MADYEVFVIYEHFKVSIWLQGNISQYTFSIFIEFIPLWYLYRMYVCMYVCMFVCTYVCMYACMYICMYVCTYACVHVCILVGIYECMYVCMFICMYVSMYVCMYICMYVYMFYVRTYSPQALNNWPFSDIQCHVSSA